MAETPEKEQATTLNEDIDLSQLGGLGLGPAWGDLNISIQQASRKSSGPGQGGKHPGGGKRGRRPSRDTFKREDYRAAAREEVFELTVDVKFYPDDKPFKALTKAIRHSRRTYQLFEIAALILEKNDRFVTVIEPKTKGTVLHCSVPDNAPFDTEEQALAHIFKHHMDKFFNTEEIEVEPPKGSFPIINKCGATGDLIGPPNFHRYQQLLQEHYNNNVSNMPFERFVSRIEGVKEQEAIDQWTEKMKKAIKYIVKDVKEGEKPQSFEVSEDARAYLLVNHKEKLVIARDKVRFAGKCLEKTMPEGPLKKAIMITLDQQRLFPLKTANNLRGRLRRMKFNLFKRGPNGVTFVSAVRRKFREPGQTFSDSIQGLVGFIQKNPNISVVRLTESYLGKKEGVEDAEMEQKSRQMMLDLTWLVDEGYVTEYGNGTLFADAPRETASQPKFEVKPKEEAATEPASQVEVVGKETFPPGPEVVLLKSLKKKNLRV